MGKGGVWDGQGCGVGFQGNDGTRNLTKSM